ncbi:uncharacterized protein [Primulina huaijiensis]|uniref:uncharacterized protein n=1 Tax=Primulina huaijiensis TaxID=1492673 RepID=UPI003CC70669
MNPPECFGGADPLVALEGIKSLEAIFDYLKFTDRDKVSCNVFMLVKAACIWWEATKVTVNVRQLKWEEFKELFYAKYFSREVKAMKVKEFLELRQDSLSVAEYTLKFEERCVFVPFIAKNDKDKGEHFLRGLKPEIRRDVHMAKVITYQDIVESALLAEHDEQEIEKERQLRRQAFQARGQGTSASTRGGYKGKGKMEQRSKHSVPSSGTERPLCPKCGKPHKGECLVGKVRGRIFTMTKEGANPDSSVISGNILISDKEALTLIDTGATQSFMSEVFMHSLSRDPTVMPLHFTIMLPSGDEICPTSILKACPVQMGTRLLYADFIVISMVAFDVILGMDWLSAYRAVIDCVRKTVKFVIDDHENNAIVGLGSSISTPIISCLQAIKLLNKGCLPPHREVEFVIYLSPGTAPISKAPYRMAPTEMKDLKNQLLELLDKGFIRPSSSPWGAPLEQEAFLGHIVSKEGIAVDPSKIEAINPWSFPKTVSEEQQLDLQLLELKNKSDLTGVSEFGLNSTGLLTFRGRICVPVGDDIPKDVLIEAHSAPYSVKIEPQRPAGTLLSLPIPQWKWEHITMDFATGLPRTSKGYNSIWVIVDRLTKSAHFLLVKTTFTMNQYAEVYVAEIVRLHGIPVSIIYDRDPRFTSEFWKSLHRALGTNLAFSTKYHPQSDGQSERMIQILEDMLRSCTIDFPGSWDSKLPLVEFMYDNSYKSSIGMEPYEALYGRK